MSDTNQSDADSLLNSLDQDSTAEGEDQVSVASSVHDEDTGHSENGKEEVVNGDPASGPDPRGKPWVDFVPEFSHQRSENRIERIEEEMQNLSDSLADKEDLRVCVLEQGIHSSYLHLWVRHSNILFKSIVRLKYRRDAEKDGTKLKEA